MPKDIFVSVLVILLVIFSTPAFALQRVAAEADVLHFPNDTVLISEIQTRTVDDANEEFIELYNPAEYSIDISDWQLEYMASSGDSWSDKIRAEQYVTPNYEIKAKSFYVFGTEKYSLSNENVLVDRTLGSGSAEGGGHVRLIKPINTGSDDNEEWLEIDRVGWGSAQNVASDTEPAEAPPQGSSITRCFQNDLLYSTGNNSIDFLVNNQPMPAQGLDCPVSENEVEDDETEVIDDEELPDTDDEASVIEDEEETPEDEVPGDDTTSAPICAGLVFSEVLPNPQGPRSEFPREDNAFIELHNITQEPISLSGCGLQTSANSNEYWFEESSSIDPNDFLALYEHETGVQLPVSPSGTVYLLFMEDNAVEEIEEITYPAAMPETASWSWLGNDAWEITYAPTPGSENKALQHRPCPEGQERNRETNRCRNIATTADSTGSLTPCLEGQERNPATNRCRNIGGTTARLVPCSSHQTRNPETNRCRNVATGSASLVPCKEGQERNPATNRCRNVTSAASDLVPCKAHQERNPETNRCRNVASDSSAVMGIEDIPVATSSDQSSWSLIGAVIGFVVIYGLWEWRNDLRSLYFRLRRQPG